MFRSLIALSLFFGLLVSGAAAQEWAEKMFDSLGHDFGPVARGAKVEHRFKVRNLYKEDVHIASVRSSCGCTSPSITDDTLATYEEAEIVAKFNTLQFKGQHQATVTVTIDRPYFAEVRLNVQGYVRRDVVFNPGKVDFGAVSSSEPIERSIALAYAGRDDWKIRDIRSANDYLEVEMQETRRGGGRVDYNLTVRLLPDAPPGYINSELLIITNDSTMTQVPLAVEGRVIAGLTVSPAALHLGTVQPGETVTKQLVVKGQSPFKVLRVDCPNGSFKFTVGDDSKKLHLIPVTFTAGESPDKVLEKFQIVTDLEDTSAPPVTAQVEVTAE